MILPGNTGFFVPETSSVMGNSKERRLNDTVSFSQDTAAKTGKSKRTTERTAQLRLNYFNRAG